MNLNPLVILAFTGGVLLAVQGGLNAQLGVKLNNSYLASTIAFFFSMLISILLFFIMKREFPSVHQMEKVPTYLWFTGGLLSAIGISIYYITIPLLGVSQMIALALCGQLTLAFIAGHFGWFGMTPDPITIKRVIGLSAMLVGIWLMQGKTVH